MPRETFLLAAADKKFAAAAHRHRRGARELGVTYGHAALLCYRTNTKWTIRNGLMPGAECPSGAGCTARAP